MSIQNKLGSFEKWIIYYLLLGIVQALWTNPSAFPPLPMRIGMTLAVFAPVLFRREAIIFVIPFFMLVRNYVSTGYSYLPDVRSYWFYIGVIILALAIHWKNLNFALLGKAKSLVFMMLFFAIADLAANGEFGPYTIHIFIGLLLIPFVTEESDFHYLSAALICASTLLSVYYIVMFDKFLSVWNSSLGIERSGWADPNYFSVTLDAGFFVAMMYLLGFCKSDYRFFNKIILAVACAVIAAAVMMTASRAGFLCIAFILIVALFTAKLKPIHFLFVSLVVAGVVFYLYSKGTMDLLLYRLFEQGNADTGGGRTTLWQELLNNFGNQDAFHQLFGGGYWHRRDLASNDTHNEFFAILGDYGIFGLLLYVIFVITLMSFRRFDFWKQNVAALFYILSVMSLSPFSYIFIMFLIIWIYAFRFNNENLLNYE